MAMARSAPTRGVVQRTRRIVGGDPAASIATSRPGRTDNGGNRMIKWRRSLVLMIAITVLLWTAVWVAVSVRGAPPSSLQPTYAVPPIRVLENNTGNNTSNDT